MHIDIEWDADKAVANFKMHSVRFEEAATSLLDPQALAHEDADWEGEARWSLATMRKQYDFSKPKRAKDAPHLARLQAEAKGKTRITIMIDNDLLMAFRAKAESEGTGYQTLINQALRQAAGTAPVDEATLRRVLREELKAG
jgi:uncharacterized protein (DUF4415 family)